jgi:large subunit ribosomal protein L4
MRGGGVAFGKTPHSHRKDMPKEMRRKALGCAILAKIMGNDLMVLQGDAPKTKPMAEIMQNLKINRSCLLTLADRDKNVYLSARNLPDITVRIAAELNAFEVATRQKMVVTSEAMQALMTKEA